MTERHTHKVPFESSKHHKERNEEKTDVAYRGGMFSCGARGSSLPKGWKEYLGKRQMLIEHVIVLLSMMEYVCMMAKRTNKGKKD